MVDNNNPCKDCPEKGCGEKHSSCIKYVAWSLAFEGAKAKASIVKNSNASADFDRNLRIQRRRRSHR